METLHWPLSILTKAIHFKNLTGASAHVGLSQPQLSRLISQLEKELGVTLLDRSAKRKSGWTQTAYRIAEIYALQSRKLQNSLQEALVAQIPTQVNIGTLEGLSEFAFEIAHSFFESSDVKEIALDIYDQNVLEEKFFNGDLDLIFTSREPGKQKFRHVIELGFQSIDKISSGDKYSVLSTFEYGRLKKKPDNKILISNSLSLRKHWLETYGGEGVVPSKVKKVAGKDLMPAIIVGGEMFNETLWSVVVKKSGDLV